MEVVSSGEVVLKNQKIVVALVQQIGTVLFVFAERVATLVVSLNIEVQQHDCFS